MTSDPSVHRVSNSDPQFRLRKNLSDASQSTELAFFDELLNIGVFDSAIEFDVNSKPLDDSSLANTNDSNTQSAENTEQEKEERESDRREPTTSLDLISLIPVQSGSPTQASFDSKEKSLVPRLRRIDSQKPGTEIQPSAETQFAAGGDESSVDPLGIIRQNQTLLHSETGQQSIQSPLQSNTRSDERLTSPNKTTDSKSINTKRQSRTEKKTELANPRERSAASSDDSVLKTRAKKTSDDTKANSSQDELLEGTAAAKDANEKPGRDSVRKGRNARGSNKEHFEETDSHDDRETTMATQTAAAFRNQEDANTTSTANVDQCWYANPVESIESAASGTSISEQARTFDTTFTTHTQNPSVVASAVAQVGSSNTSPGAASATNSLATSGVIGVTSSTMQSADTSASHHSESPRGAVRSTISPYQQSKLVHRVLRGLEQLGDGGGQVKLRLHPPELGALQLTLRIDAGQMHAHLEVENSLARDALLSNVQTLRDRLSDQGMQIESFEVQVATDNLSSNTNSTGQSGQGSGSQLNWTEARSRFAQSNDNRKESQVADGRDQSTTNRWIRKFGTLDLTV